MQAYAYELTMDRNGVLTLRDLPFKAGEKIEVIIVPRSGFKQDKHRYPFRGKPITYLDPTEPVAETEWEVLK